MAAAGDMTEGPPLRLILKFGAPMLIGSIFQQFYNVVDMLIVGNINGSRALASIGATGPATFMFLALVMGLSTAFSAVMSQYFGAKDFNSVRKTLVSSIYYTVLCIVILSVVGFLTAAPIMRLLQTPDDIFADAVLYMQICLGLCFGQVIYNTASAVLRAIGDSKTPLIFLIVSSLLNVALDFLFILGFGMGVAGAGIATILAQIISAILCVVYMLKKFEIFQITKADLRPDLPNMGMIAKIGLPISFQVILLSMGEMTTSGVINSFGTDVVAANASAMRIQQFAMMLCMTISNAFAVYAGQNLGAQKIERIKDGFKKIGFVILAICVAATLLVFIFGGDLVRIFISNEDIHIDTIVAIAHNSLRIQSCFYLFLGFIWLYNNTLRGMGDVFVPLISGFVELAAKIGLSISLSMVFGYIGIWFAGPIGWAIGLLPSLIRYHSGGWQKLSEKFKAAEQ